MGLEEEAPMGLRKVGGQGNLHGGGDIGSRPSWALRDSLEISGWGEHSWYNCVEAVESLDVILKKWMGSCVCGGG